MFGKYQKMIATKNVQKLAAVVGTIALLSTTGCKNQANTSTAQPSTGSSAIAQPENSSSNPNFQNVTLIDGLENPWGIDWLPNGNMLITERPGQVRLVQNGTLTSNPIPGVPNIFTENQGGLLDIALHPQFAENRLVYFTYSDGTSSANQTQIGRAHV